MGGPVPRRGAGLFTEKGAVIGMMKGCKLELDFSRPPRSLVQALGKYPTSNLDDAMARLSAISPAIRALNASPLCGTALTVRLPAGDNLLFLKAIELAQPGDVLVVDAGGCEEHSLFGEILSLECRLRGVAGIVADGYVRDLDAIAAMTDFAVYARGSNPNGPYKNGPGEIGTAVQIGGRVVRAGDIVVGDADGVVIIPPAEAEDVLAGVRAVQQREERLLMQLRRGELPQRAWVEEKLMLR